MASLVLTDGPAEGQLLSLGNHSMVSIGRDDQCTFQLLDEQVSRKHLQVTWDARAERHLAGDYRSANGVYVNERRIAAETPLREGDRIRIGLTTMVYTLRDFDDATKALEAIKQSGEWKRSTIVRK